MVEGTLEAGLLLELGFAEEGGPEGVVAGGEVGGEGEGWIELCEVGFGAAAVAGVGAGGFAEAVGEDRRHFGRGEEVGEG